MKGAMRVCTALLLVVPHVAVEILRGGRDPAAPAAPAPAPAAPALPAVEVTFEVSNFNFWDLSQDCPAPLLEHPSKAPAKKKAAEAKVVKVKADAAEAEEAVEEWPEKKRFNPFKAMLKPHNPKPVNLAAVSKKLWPNAKYDVPITDCVSDVVKETVKEAVMYVITEGLSAGGPSAASPAAAGNASVAPVVPGAPAAGFMLASAAPAAVAAAAPGGVAAAAPGAAGEPV